MPRHGSSSLTNATSSKADAQRGLDVARAGLSAVSSHVIEHVQTSLDVLADHAAAEPGADWVEAEEKIRSALEGMLPSAMAIVSELWDTASENSRQQIKALQLT